MKNSQQGAVHLLLLAAVIGVISFVAISALVPFRDRLLTTLFPKQSSQAAGVGDWPMAGANPERTSYVADGPKGDLNEIWAAPIEPYIPVYAGPIAADGKIFVSTAKGLYAFDATNGAIVWVYPTEMPLGHSPTYDNGTLYVGGLDHKLHAINATTGAQLWTFKTTAGIITNPVVANGNVYFGARDGIFYAVRSQDQTGAGTKPANWTNFQAGGQIDFSPAYKDNTLYFAAMDGYGYAIDATTGAQIWKSTALEPNQPLPGQGFQSWWPVIDGNYVMFTRRAESNMEFIYQGNWLFPDLAAALHKPPGELDPNTGTTAHQQYDIRTNPNDNGATPDRTIPNYLEMNPLRRSLFVLNRSDGKEIQFDVDNDGITDGPPLLITSKTNNLYPPVVSPDGTIYGRSPNYVSGPSNLIPGALPVGWRIDKPNILTMPASVAVSNNGHMPQDEPTGLALAGNFLYWDHCCNRYVGSTNLALPQTNYNTINSARQWRFNNGSIPPQNDTSMPHKSVRDPVTGIMPTTNQDYWVESNKFMWHPECQKLTKCHINHGDTIAPILYQDRLYVIRSNALIAFAPVANSSTTGTNAPVLPRASTITICPTGTSWACPVPGETSTKTELLNKLNSYVLNTMQVAKAAGGLQSGWKGIGLFNPFSTNYDNKMTDLWHSPGENLQILLKVREKLTTAGSYTITVAAIDEFIKCEYSPIVVLCPWTNTTKIGRVPPQINSHIGFQTGASRDGLNLWNRLSGGEMAIGPQGGGLALESQNAYAIWRWSVANPGNEGAVYSAIKNITVTPPPTDSPHRANQYNRYLAYCYGYLKIWKAAGSPADTIPTGSTITRAQQCQQNIPTYQNLRLNMTADLILPGDQTTVPTAYYSVCIQCWNFLHLTPDLVSFLIQNNQQSHIKSTIKHYTDQAPYWMVGHNAEVQYENGTTPYQQTYTLFQAKALLAKESLEELSKYLDQPVTPIGDMYYIDNLVAAIDAPSVGIPPTPPPTSPPATATPSPTSAPGGSLTAATGQAIYRSTTVPDETTSPKLSEMITEAVDEAKNSYTGSQPPKVIITINNAGGQDALIAKIKSVFGNNVPVAGEGTGSEKYPTLTNEEFVEPLQRSVAVLALGGDGLDNICSGCMNQQVVGQGANLQQIKDAGKNLALGLQPHINSDPNKQNLILILGPGHHPNLEAMFGEIAAVLGNGGSIPDNVKFIGGGADFDGNSIANGVFTPLSVTAVLLQGNFKLALRGVGPGFGGDPVQKSTDLMTEMKNELGGSPDITFYIAGHPDLEGASRALMLTAAQSVLGSNAKIFGNTGGGEYGHLKTNDQPLALPQYFFIAGLKGNSGSSTSTPPPSIKTGDIIVNNKVDIFDYNALLTDFGKKNDPLTPADLDNDNDVDIFDYNLLLTNFGQ